MKRVLITGANSYVGTNVEKWLMKEPDEYYVETLDMKDPNWRKFDFSKFDVVFHVAGIAHISTKKSMKDLYFKVNRDLAIEVAKHSKESMIKQFIFMSSMIIYGKDNCYDDKKNIDINNYFPINAYGKSKLEADLSIIKLSDNYFKVQIIRTPVIYGPDCKGNFPKLQKLAKLMFIVPRITNQKSMIYIENFTEFIKQSINHMLEGVFYPQNSRYMSTSDILILTRKYMGKKTLQTTLMNPLLRFLSKYSSIFRKIFGNKTYDLSLSNYSLFNYNIVSVEESIKKSLEGHK